MPAESLLAPERMLRPKNEEEADRAGRQVGWFEVVSVSSFSTECRKGRDYAFDKTWGSWARSLYYSIPLPLLSELAPQTACWLLFVFTSWGSFKLYVGTRLALPGVSVLQRELKIGGWDTRGRAVMGSVIAIRTNCCSHTVQTWWWLYDIRILYVKKRKWYSPCEKKHGGSSKLQYYPTIPLPGICTLQNWEQRSQCIFCAPMLTAALVTVYKMQKEPKGPSPEEWVTKWPPQWNCAHLESMGNSDIC